MWKILHDFADRTHHMGEACSWIAGTIGSVTAIFGVVTPDVVQQWVLMAFGLVLAGAGFGSAIYMRLTKAKLEGQTLEVIFRANQEAFLAGKPLPSPEFWPKPQKAK